MNFNYLVLIGKNQLWFFKCDCKRVMSVGQKKIVLKFGQNQLLMCPKLNHCSLQLLMKLVATLALGL